MAMAIFSFVPTPSALETSTGSRHFLSSANKSAERTDPADHAARERARSQAPDALLGLIRKRNIHTCFGVVHEMAGCSTGTLRELFLPWREEPGGVVPSIETTSIKTI